jgi:ArsR family transcriptional regulator
MKECPPEESISQLLETIGKPARLRILFAIGAGEACVCHLEAVLGLRQAYISQHLMALRQADLLDTRREGRYIFYRLSDPRLLQFIREASRLSGVTSAERKTLEQTSQESQCSCPHCTADLQPESVLLQITD